MSCIRHLPATSHVCVFSPFFVITGASSANACVLRYIFIDDGTPFQEIIRGESLNFMECTKLGPTVADQVDDVNLWNLCHVDDVFTMACFLLNCEGRHPKILHKEQVTDYVTYYSQVLIYTAESTGATMERTKMPNLRNGSKGGFEPGLT